MKKIWHIAAKELQIVLRDRNLILIMFLTPVVLATIMGFAFGGLGDSSNSSFQHMPVALVNLDAGFDLQQQIGVTDTNLSLHDLKLNVDGAPTSVGELLQANTDITDTALRADNANFNFGDQLASILASKSITSSNGLTNTATFNLADLTCPLLTANEDAGQLFAFEGALDDLFDVDELTDVEAARAAVERGDYVAAVIIPANFSNQMMPTFNFGGGGAAAESAAEGQVEVYGSSGSPISALIVRSVVEGIVSQFTRVSVALGATADSAVTLLLQNFNLANFNLADLNISTQALNSITGTLQTLDASVLDPLGCLLTPGASNLQVKQRPLDQTQTLDQFSFIMIVLGSAQAVFFALFTGIFGMNSVYEEKRQWTLQRLIASPTPPGSLLLGKLIGNLLVVAFQLSVLLLAFTVIASLVNGQPTFIYGRNVPGVAVVVLAIALFTSGLGALVVGLFKTPEQVQFFGPMISATLGALGGSFGFRLPPAVGRISPIYWGVSALEKLGTGEPGLALDVGVLLAIGVTLFVVGAILFRRRMAV
ncbi:MAG: ABC transporter permease [Caldilineaceae bacterium]